MQEAQPAVWEQGSYEEIAPAYYPMAGHLVERAAVGGGDEVLDIACGTGSVSITAARRGADVTGVDITPAMLDRAQRNAATADVVVDWQEGDACELPVENDAFDVTLSSLGHMYGDPPVEATRELLRVTGADGRIGFTSWTPTSLFPFMGSVLLTYLAPADQPDFSEPPFAWGDSDTVRERLEQQVSQLAFETDTVIYPALSPAHFWEEMAQHSGMFRELLPTIDDDQRDAVREEMIETIQPYFDERANGVELEYLLSIAKR